MEKKIFKTITIVLLYINITALNIHACGWYENPEGYRMSVFRAEIAALMGYRSFYYTPDLMHYYLPDFNNDDRKQNCKEWQSILDESIKTNDIFTILYKVDPEMFLLPYKDSKLNDIFEGNTFIEQLLLPKNKEWLDYLAFAKRNEFNNQYLNDPWSDSYYQEKGSISHELMLKAETKLGQIKNKKLLERYAYHLIRLYRQTEQNRKCINAYNKYFSNEKSNSILKNWSQLHKAEAFEAIDSVAEANYQYSLVFNSGEEKRIRAYKLFDKKLLEQTLQFAKNKNEVAGIWAIMAIKNPGPALEAIKNVIKNNPSHASIPLLIMREVNKLEDWIFTPELTRHSPSIHTSENFNEWNHNYERIKKTNRSKDLQYLSQFNAYLKDVSGLLSPEINDYIKLARAHLHLIARENKTALQLFNSISPKAPEAIQIQKNIELALYYTYENELTDNNIKKKLASILSELEKLLETSSESGKQIQSLCEIISNAYHNSGDIVSAGLLKLKAEGYKNAYENGEINGLSGWNYRDYYWNIAFFDRFAGPKDIDRLIMLLEKKHKSKFEDFLCKQPMATKNALLDLKGTLALRLGDLKTASNAFSLIPHNYWENTYEYSTYLNENPFIPPNISVSATKYHFNKADILKQLVQLEEEARTISEKAAENYIKLGHFFYNASYWGNSWMMLSYSWTSAPKYGSTTFGYHDILFGDLLKNAKAYETNYYKCTSAMNYYQKAEKLTTDKEQLAMIYFMKHCCSYNQFLWQEKFKDWNAEKNKFSATFIADLYKKYQNTETFWQIRCPMLDDFASEMGIDN